MRPRYLLPLAACLALAVAPADTQPPAVGALGRFPVPAVVKMSGDSLVVTARIARDETYDPTLRLYTLHLNPGAVTVMGHAELPLVQWLEQRVGQRVPITFGEGQ